MKYILRGLLVILFSATIAAWLKMGVPHLSIGYWPIWKEQSLRNRVGIFIAMPLYELLYLGYFYIFSTIIYGIIAFRWRVVRTNQTVATLIGVLVSTTVYSAYKLDFYLKSTRMYDAHRGLYPSKPWYRWVEYPEDVELLIIYTVTGLLGGWLYYRLINRQSSVGNDFK